jgi:hypothetical protein
VKSKYSDNEIKNKIWRVEEEIKEELLRNERKARARNRS